MKSLRIKATHNKIHSAQTMFALAQIAFDSSEIRTCLKHAQQTVRLEPDHLGSWELVARSQWRLGQFSEALLTLERLVSLNPYEPGYFYLKGMILQGLGQCGSAIEAMQRCLGFDESPVAGQALTALKELEQWQAILIADALASDRVFRIEYARNPVLACQSKGFRLTIAEQSRAHARREATVRAMHWTRNES
jgi:tetratricopeptide (TPR) repeat protein